MRSTWRRRPRSGRRGLRIDAAIELAAAGGSTWTLWLLDTGAVPGSGHVFIEYPAAIDLLSVSIAKLDELARLGVREVHPRLVLTDDERQALTDASA